MEIWMAAHRRCLALNLQGHFAVLMGLIAVGAPTWSLLSRHPREYALSAVAICATWVTVEFYAFATESFKSQYLSKVLRAGRIRNAANSLLTVATVTLPLRQLPGPSLVYLAGLLAMYLRAVKGSGGRLAPLLLLDLVVSRLLLLSALWMFRALVAGSFWGIVGAAGAATTVIAVVMAFNLSRSRSKRRKLLQMLVRYQRHDRVARRILTGFVLPRVRRAATRRAARRRRP